MTDRPSPPGDGAQVLRFACACASAVPVAEDPWVAIVNQRKLNDGTKELILNALYRRPRTVAQLAQQLGLSAAGRAPPCRGAARQRADPRGGRAGGWAPVGPRTLLPAQFPGRARRRSGGAAARAGRARRRDSPRPFRPRAGGPRARPSRAPACPPAGNRSRRCSTTCTPTATRMARERLEADGDLPPWPEHADGSRWVWWAEEPPETEVA